MCLPFCIIHKQREYDFEEKSELLMKMMLQGYKLLRMAEKLNIFEEDVFTLADMKDRDRKNVAH